VLPLKPKCAKVNRAWKLLLPPRVLFRSTHQKTLLDAMPLESHPPIFKYPLYSGMEFINNGRWKIIGHDEGLLSLFPSNPEIFYEIMSVDRETSVIEARSHEELFDKFFDRLPKEFIHHRELFKSRLWRSPEVWELARPVF